MQKNILVVEDDPDILLIVELVLTEAGYQVFPFPDGDRIFEHLAAASPDLVILDIQLPNVDGRELCKNIKKTHPEMPVILMSANIAYSGSTDVSCANSFIAKPFDIDFLISQVHNYIPLGV